MTNNSPAPSPNRANRLLLGKLYEKKSQSTGQKFFIGSLGFLKLVVFHDDNAPEDNVWNVFVVERDANEQRPRQAPAQGQGQGPQSQGNWQGQPNARSGQRPGPSNSEW